MKLFLSRKNLTPLNLRYPIDGIELRIEQFDKAMLYAIKKWKQKLKYQVIFAWKLPFDERLIKQLLLLEPDYIDIDIKEDVGNLPLLYPQVKWIRSYHNFEKPPLKLDLLLRSMRKVPADLYKIATMACSILDTLRMIELTKKNKDVIGLCMGDKGAISRLLAPVTQMPINYTCLPGEETAPGQIDIQTLYETYRIDHKSPSTKLFGLIGDPVHLSDSHETHNAVFALLRKEALYVKMQVTVKEVKEALERLEQIGFEGLSVTHPLKYEVAKLLKVKEGAVNTVHFKNEQRAINTDGKGALHLLKRLNALSDKHYLVIGASHTARAIIQELKAHPIEIAIWNRTKKKEKQFIEQFDCRAWDSTRHYDVIIQATSVGLGDKKVKFPFEQFISKGAIAFEVIANPFCTPFLRVAKKQGCQTVEGYRLFIEQAILQFEFWLGHAVEFNALWRCMEKVILKRRFTQKEIQRQGEKHETTLVKST